MTYEQLQIAYRHAEQKMKEENISWEDALNAVLAGYEEVA